MEESKAKKLFKFKSVEVHRSASVHVGSRWQRFEYGVHIDILDEKDDDAVVRAKVMGERFVDYCIDRRMDRRGLEQRADLNWKPESIAWVQATGQNGKYERSYDRTKPEHKRIIEDLKSLKQPFEFNGYVYWIFDDGTIGRKSVVGAAARPKE